MLIRILSCACLLPLMAACATSSKERIHGKLVDVGIPEKHAHCMGNKLQERLAAHDLAELATYINTLSAAQTARESVDALLTIDNPRAVRAITTSAISCVFVSKEE